MSESLSLNPDQDGVSRGPDSVLGLAVLAGVATIVGGVWWWTNRSDPSPTRIGHVLCPTSPYKGSIHRGDYVVIELRSNDKSFAEPTWAEVLKLDSSAIEVRIVGESDNAESPKPLITSRHGFKIGDVVVVSPDCIYDRFRPSQTWSVLCGPALASTGRSPISGQQSSILGQGDDAMVVLRGRTGKTEAIWLRIGSVSTGQQILSGVVITPPAVADHGALQGDVIDFLRDCVVDASFS